MSRVAQSTHRLEVELESGGNLRYEPGTPSIGWSVTNRCYSNFSGPYQFYTACPARNNNDKATNRAGVV